MLFRSMNDSTSIRDVRATLALVSMPERSLKTVQDSAWHTPDKDAQTLSSWRAPTDRDALTDQVLLNALQVAVSDLFQAVRAAINDDREAAMQSWHRAIAALGSKLVSVASDESRSAGPYPSRLIKGGLTSWQIGRVNTHIDSHIDAKIHVRDLAALTRLTQSHFCRTFKESCGDSPHRYLMRRRIEHAQRLMLTTSTPLCQIAVAVGLADQPHFNRIFRKFVGQSPGSWRRARTFPEV